MSTATATLTPVRTPTKADQATIRRRKHELRIREAIVRLMRTYGPKLSTTMVGIHVRPFGTDWRDIFEEMIRDGTVIRETENVGGRIVFIHQLAPEHLATAV
jgi:hypothetical protein